MLDKTRGALGLAALQEGIIRPGGAAAGRWPVWLMYAFAVAVTATTMIIRLGLEETFGEHLFLIVFIIPILLSAYAGGLGPGLLSTLMSAATTSYFIISPIYSFSFTEGADGVQWLILIVNGMFISGLSEALHRSRQRAERSRLLQAVTLASVGDGIITTDIRGNITFLNQEAERLTGWSRQEAAGQPLSAVFRLINAEKRQPTEDQVEKVFASGEGASLGDDHVLLNKDGGELAIEASSAPIKYADGALDGVVLVFHDHSEKKRAEAALRESEERYRQLVEMSPDGIMVHVQGRFVFANQAGAQLLGAAAPEELYGREVMDLIHPDSRELASARMQKIYGGEQTEPGSLTILRLDEQPVEVEARTKLIDYQGQAAAMAMLRDITEHKRTLREIKRLASFPQLNPFPVLEVDAAGAITFYNQGAVEALEKLGPGCSLADFMPPDLEEIQAAARHTGEKLFWREVRIKDAVFSEAISFVPLFDVLRFYTIDVTERQQAEEARIRTLMDLQQANESLHTEIWERQAVEEALRESEEHYRSLFDNMLNGYAFCHMVYEQEKPVDFVYLEVNRAFEMQTGLKDVVGKKVSEVIPGVKESNPELMEIYGRVATTCIPERFEIYVAALDMWFSVSVYCPRKEYFVAVFDVITERKRAEEAIKISEARLRRAEALGHLGHWSLDLRKIPVRLSGSEEMFRIFGVAPHRDDFTYQDLLQLIHPEDREDVNQIMDMILREGQADFGCRLLRPDGELRYINGMGELVHNESGENVAIFGTILDTTEIRQKERELEERNAEMERFTYTISHDLKSPLVTIKTFLEYLSQDMVQGDGERIEKDMFYLHSAADKMGHLLDELLEMSRIGRIINPPVAATFREVVEEALQTVAGSIAARGVEVKVSEKDCRLLGDYPRLVEIWQNLVDNAVKFMGDQTSPQIEIGVERRQKEAVFFVCDNGMGIDSRYQKKIFDLFEKLDPKTEGTGIGLALVKRIVEYYRGSIWLESKGLGQGTCFKFTLPGAVKESKLRR